jgi:hypothetical protein
MTYHFHLLLETIDGNLSRGMRQLNVRITKTVDVGMLDPILDPLWIPGQARDDSNFGLK